MIKVIQCSRCLSITLLDLPEKEYNLWIKGELTLTEAFPNVDPNLRHMLADSICPDCWDEIFENENKKVH